MWRITLLLIFNLCISNTGISQKFIKSSSSKLKKKFAKSAEFANLQEYSKAIDLCNDILKKEPNNVDVLLRKGTYLRYVDELDAAEKIFKQAIFLAPDYDNRMYFSLGSLQFAKANYLEAIKNLNYFLAGDKKSKKQVIRSRRMIRDAEFSKEAISNPVPFTPIRLGEEINTEKWECLPYMMADGSQMIYLSIDPQEKDNYKKQRLYSSDVNGKEFTQGIPFEGFQYKFGEGAHCISADGKTIIFTSCDFDNSPYRTSLGGCDLYISEFKNGQWSAPSNLGPAINTRNWESQPCLNADGTELYFSSKRRNSIGGADLYKSVKNTLGQWQAAENLGKSINTSGDDESPFLHQDGKSFYFRSNGRAGMGDFDIYFTHWDVQNEQWGEVKNLGYPINTKADDGAIFIDLNGTKAYFTSNRYSIENNLEPNLDIYSFDLYEEARPIPTTYVKGKIINGITGEGVFAETELFDGDQKRVVKTDETGAFLITLPSFKDYSFHVEKEGFLLASDRFELKDIKQIFEAFELEIVLWPIPKKEAPNEPIAYNQVIPLNNILFETGSAQLVSSSNYEIEKLSQMLTDNPTIKIEIHGHTDNVGSESDNMKLSTNRAKSVYQALIDLGINSNRLNFKGYGESVSIADNETEEGRSLNRRTEFIVIKNKG